MKKYDKTEYEDSRTIRKEIKQIRRKMQNRDQKRWKREFKG